MTNHKVHDTLPDGFAFADRLQIDSFMKWSSVDGASKIALVAGEGDLPRLACRLRPPRRPGYVAEYKTGWADAKRPDANAVLDSQAYADGYRDRAEHRMKWHLAYCKSHGDHEGGCRA